MFLIGGTTYRVRCNESTSDKEYRSYKSRNLTNW